ncbi:hypothetical protein ACVWXM_009906 [Bradyrhizobium sp. GM7.3]
MCSQKLQGLRTSSLPATNRANPDQDQLFTAAFGRTVWRVTFSPRRARLRPSPTATMRAASVPFEFVANDGGATWLRPGDIHLQARCRRVRLHGRCSCNRSKPARSRCTCASPSHCGCCCRQAQRGEKGAFAESEAHAGGRAELLVAAIQIGDYCFPTLSAELAGSIHKLKTPVTCPHPSPV